MRSDPSTIGLDDSSQSSSVAFAVLAPRSPQAPGLVRRTTGAKESRTLTLTKECGTATLAPGELATAPSLNRISARSEAQRSAISDRGFSPPDHPFLDSRVVIESAHGGGGTAFGHCLVRGVPDVLGACQFTGGSGSLQGFKADVTVTTVDGTIWHWNGHAFQRGLSIGRPECLRRLACASIPAPYWLPTPARR